FSSRRRHTRCYRDWSSDVCSSDLCLPDSQPLMRDGGEVRIGIVGYGMMGRAHAYGYTVAPVMRTLAHRPRVCVISGRDKEKVAGAAAAYGIPDSVADWHDLVKRPDVDIVDICTPPGTHAEIA